jgi:hypothetical protein
MRQVFSDILQPKRSSHVRFAEEIRLVVAGAPPAGRMCWLVVRPSNRPQNSRAEFARRAANTSTLNLFRCNSSALKTLPQGFDQIQNRALRAGEPEAPRGFHIAFRKVCKMQDQNVRNLAVATKMSGHRHVQLGGIDLRETAKAQSRQMAVDPLNLLPAVPRPERPTDKISLLRWWKLCQTVDAAVLAHPVANFRVIRMRILPVSSILGLLRGEEALLCFGDFVQPPGNLSMRSHHNTIPQFE